PSRITWRARLAVKGPSTPRSRRARRSHRVFIADPIGSIAVDRIEDRLNARDAGGGDPGRLGVTADLVLAVREIDAVELVVGHVALHPLDVRPHAGKSLARFLRGRVELSRGHAPCARNVALDDIFFHCFSLCLGGSCKWKGQAAQHQSQSQWSKDHVNLPLL